MGSVGVGWELEGVVGVVDDVEGVEVRSASGRRSALGTGRTGWRGALGSSMVLGPRLRGDDGGRATLVEDGLELDEVAVFGVAGTLDEEHGDGDAREVGEGVWQEGAPAVGVDVADEAVDVGQRFPGEKEGHDLGAHGASGEEEGEVGGEVLGGLDGGAGGGEEDSEGVDEVFGVAGLEAMAVGVVVAEGGDVVVGEGLGHVVHEGSARGGTGAVAEDEEGEGVGGLEEEGGEVGAGRLGGEGGLVELHGGVAEPGFRRR